MCSGAIIPIGWTALALFSTLLVLIALFDTMRQRKRLEKERAREFGEFLDQQIIRATQDLHDEFRRDPVGTHARYGGSKSPGIAPSLRAVTGMVGQGSLA